MTHFFENSDTNLWGGFWKVEHTPAAHGNGKDGYGLSCVLPNYETLTICFSRDNGRGEETDLKTYDLEKMKIGKSVTFRHRGKVIYRITRLK